MRLSKRERRAKRTRDIAEVAPRDPPSDPDAAYGIRIGEVRILSPTPAMIIVGVTTSSPVK